MVVGNPNYATELLTTTIQRYLEKEPQDTIFNTNVLIEQLTNQAKKMTKGGSTWLVPLMYGRNATGGSYSGWDEGDVSPQEGLTNAEFHPKYYRWSVSISGQDEEENSGEAQVIDLLMAKWQQMKMSAQDDMNIALYADGTANSSKAVTGLALAVDSTGTYGNIVRSANTWWASQETAVGSVLQIQGSSGMRRLYNDCSRGQGSKAPNLWITTQPIFEAYEALLDPNMRYSNRGTGDVGLAAPSLEFRGRPLYWDDACTTQTMFALNTEFLAWYVLRGRDFTPGPFKEPLAQDGKIAWTYWAGQLVTSNCRHQGKLTGISNS